VLNVTRVLTKNIVYDDGDHHYSRAVGYASHKGQRLGVEKLTEHVRLCIRHEDQTGGGAAAQGGGAGGAGADA
jgi:hypothetical protein